MVAVGSAAVWEAWTAGCGLHWYAGLIKPSFSPTPTTALALSAILSVTMAWAFYRVLRRPDYLPGRRVAIRLFAVALVLDALWAWLFFAGRHPSTALAAAAALAAVAAVSAVRFAAVDRRAGLLLTPWVSATGLVFLLDLSIALRNG